MTSIKNAISTVPADLAHLFQLAAYRDRQRRSIEAAATKTDMTNPAQKLTGSPKALVMAYPVATIKNRYASTELRPNRFSAMIEAGGAPRFPIFLMALAIAVSTTFL